MKTEYAQAARQIRKILKTNFPQTTFSVQSKGYSGGDSINVSWTDGPTSKEVEAHISHYQEGHFDGMTDMYNYTNNREDIPQTKFLFCNRKMSKETQEQIIKEHNEEWCEEGQITDIRGWNEDANEWNQTVVHRKFSEMSMAGAEQ